MAFFFIGILILRIFSPWWSSLSLSAGDWPYLYLENITEFSWLPEIRYLWLAPYYQVLTKIAVQYGGIPWVITEKIFWFFPFVLLSLYGSHKLTKSVIGALIYTTNTYALMIIGGGQLGIAMAYAIAPLVLVLISRQGFLLNGLLLSAQMMFDPRITILTLVASIILGRFSFSRLFSSLSIAVVFNLYWIIPFLQHQLPIAQQMGEATVGSVKFLSFATFEQTISLLHPNWPENIFGSVHFMQSEFLILPIVAFLSLLFAKKSRSMIYVALLGLVGAFLAKGANPPFGNAYIWLFDHVPGFILFRDPTKFYLYVALSYSVLTPFVFERLRQRLSRPACRQAGIAYHVSLITFLIFWSVTLREALLGQLTGTFKPMAVPQEYVKLKNFLNAQPESFQTLWIPQRQRFGFASTLHPGIDAHVLTGQSSISGILAWIQRNDVQKELTSMNIKYVVVGYDARGELFLTDRKYDEVLYRQTLEQLIKVPWLGKRDEFGRIGVFEIQ